MNQIQKNAKDINSRLEMIENNVLFKPSPPKPNGMLPDAKVNIYLSVYQLVCHLASHLFVSRW